MCRMRAENILKSTQLGRVDYMSLSQICGDWLSIAREQNGGIAGYVEDLSTAQGKSRSGGGE